VRLTLLVIIFAISLLGSEKLRFDFDSMELSEVQAKEMKNILKAYKHNGKQANKRLHSLHEAKEELFLSEHFDSVAYSKLEEEENTLKKGRIRLLENTHKILNAKQREQFYKMYESYERSGSW